MSVKATIRSQMYRSRWISAEQLGERALVFQEPLSASDRRRLVRVWHRTNVLRLVALAIAALSLRRATRPYGDA